MELSPQTEIDAWLRQGGVVVASSERAARSLSVAFHRARRAEGLMAWPSPAIQDWNAFVRSAWSSLSTESPMILNATQEQSIWAQIAAGDGHLATQLEAPLYRVAGLAMTAHELLCSHTPRSLQASARSGWQGDAGAFSQWLSAFDQACRSSRLVSASRLPLQLVALLRGTAAKPEAARPALLLAGFDRLLPHQRAVFDAWGSWHECAQRQPAAQVHFHGCVNLRTELAACAQWCSRQLATYPDTRLLVIAQKLSAQRGPLERAFLASSNPPPPFEFSLGVPLGKVDLPRAALLLLRWLSGPLAEHEIDWLFSTRYLAEVQQSAALQARMRELRRCGMQQPDWTLRAFLRPSGLPSEGGTHDRWTAKVMAAQRQLSEKARSPQSPLVWSEFVVPLLDSIGFAVSQSLTSLEFQSAHRWEQALETAGSLGFDGRRIAWSDFLSHLARTLDDTLFAAQSLDASIQIAGPAESSGLTADAIWFLGATEDAWPAAGATHPLIPADLQRETAMPHSSAQLDWDLAQTMTTRLLASAPVVHFSFAHQTDSAESRPSRLVAQLAGAPQPLPPDFAVLFRSSDRTETIKDISRIPLPNPSIGGGAAVLTAQSQCPFKAFASARLGAQSWEPAEAGLTASQRGQLLHDVLHAVWAGPPDGVRTHSELIHLADRRGFVAGHVRRVFEAKVRPDLRDRMPARYLALEELRLTRLVAEWLDYESTRLPFEVLETEVKRTRPVAGLSLNLRLDRLDRLNDGSVLVLDYKSGDVTPRAWDPPRPEDVQLPLYARFALDDEVLGGLAFAKVRPGSLEFAGCIGDAAATLFANIKGTQALARNALSAEQLESWDESIEQLAQHFLAGHAEVDPRDYPKTCDGCGLQSLCRVQEHRIAIADGDEDENGDSAPTGSLDA